MVGGGGGDLCFVLTFCAGEFGDVISTGITLPPSKYSWTVTVTKQTPNYVLLTKNVSSPNTIPLYSVPSTTAWDVKETVLRISVGGLAASSEVASAVDVSTINSALGTLDLGEPSRVLTPDLLSHLRERPSKDPFHILKEILKQYPTFCVGWRKCSWVVIICGQDIGIFYDFWYVLRLVPSMAK